MGKGKSGGWVKFASVGVCSTLTIWAIYVASGKFLEDKDYLILYLCPSPSVLHKNFPIIYAQLLIIEWLLN